MLSDLVAPSRERREAGRRGQWADPPGHSTPRESIGRVPARRSEVRRANQTSEVKWRGWVVDLAMRDRRKSDEGPFRSGVENRKSFLPVASLCANLEDLRGER